MGEPVVELLHEAKAAIGEGPSWDARSKQLYWVDIERGEVHTYDPQEKRDSSIKLGGFVSSVVPYEKGGRLALTMQHGFYSLEPSTGMVSPLGETELDMPKNRFNDGKCDVKGRYWAGTMGMGKGRAAGSLYRLAGDRSLRMKTGVEISNGLGWSPENDVMYYIDSPRRTVTAFRYDLDRGTIRGGKIVADYSKEQGSPDGMAVDEEGMIWVAQWGGYRVSRWDPKKRKVLEEIRVPAPNVSSCCFGGKDLTDLYITTATIGLSESVLRRYPYSGGLFRARVGVKGLPTNYFRPD